MSDLFSGQTVLPNYYVQEQVPFNSTSVALEASRLVHAGECRLFGFAGFNNKGAAQFIQVFDAEQIPAAGTVPVLTLTAAATSNFSGYWGSVGRWFYRGIVIANSSTAATFTVGLADCFFDVQYAP